MANEDKRQKFLEAKKERERKEAQAKKTSFTPYVHPEYCVLNKGAMTIFRPVKTNSPMIPVDGDDNRFFSSTFMVGDNGNKFPFSWGFDGYMSHPIASLVKKVTKGKWDKATNTKKYDNDGCPLLGDILSNLYAEKSDNNGWRGSRVVLMNIIDRMDDWCAENKSAKVLVKQAEYQPEYERWNTSYGFGGSIYNEMVQKADDKYTFLNGVDFAVDRYKDAKKSGTVDVYYKTFMPEHDPQLLGEYGNGAELEKLFKTDDLTEEEANYKTWDFSSLKLYQPSSVTLFLSKKKEFVKKVDAKYNTNFLEEFQALAEKEREEWSQADQEEEAKTEEVSTPSTEVADDPKPSRRRGTTEAKKEEVAEVKSINDIYKGLDKLTDEEMELVIINEDENEITFDVALSDLEPCEKCSMTFPVDFGTCPKCGQSYNN